MKKSHIQKGAIVIIVLLLFIGFIQYRDYKDMHFPVSKKVFQVKKSLDEIMNDAYKDYPQLSGAFKYGVGVNVKKDIPLVSERRDLKIGEVWINPGSIYLFYSVNLLKGDKSLKNIPKLQVGKITFHRDNGPDFSADINKEDFGPPNTYKATYDYRVYQRLINSFQYNNLDFNDQTQLNNFQNDYLNHVTSISLGDVTMVLGKKKTALDNIKLPVGFNFDKYLVKTIPINKEIQLGDTKVKVENYQKYFNHGELNYKAENGNINDILNIEADVHVEDRLKTYNWDTDQSIPKTLFLSNGKQYFPSIEAKAVTITPKEYGYIDKKPIKIHIDQAKLKKLQSATDSELKVADIKNGSIFISLGNGDGWRGFNLIFKYDPSKYPHVGQMNWITRDMYQNQPEDQRNSILHYQQLIDIEDEDGHSLSTFGPQGMSNEAGKDTYQFGSADRINWLDFSGLDITLQSLVYMNKISAEPITIQLGN